jgi:hypothetical protein
MIHYHGADFNPTHEMVKVFPSRHAIVSYAYPAPIEIAAEICQSVILDNGAFTAWKRGEAYDFDGYAAWCRHWLRHPAVDWCVIPDAIDGSEADNDYLLNQWELPESLSVPVWHLHESLERLERLMRYPRVALGSSGVYADPGSNDWWHRMTEAMAVLCDAEGFPKVKIHGLRMLNPGIFSKLPLASADSSMVARNVGMDVRWRTNLVPKSKVVRAAILMERIERHASAAFWNPDCIGAYQNTDLFG